MNKSKREVLILEMDVFFQIILNTYQFLMVQELLRFYLSESINTTLWKQKFCIQNLN